MIEKLKDNEPESTKIWSPELQIALEGQSLHSFSKGSNENLPIGQLKQLWRFQFRGNFIVFSEK